RTGESRLKAIWNRVAHGKPYLDVTVPYCMVREAVEGIVQESAWGKWYAAQCRTSGNAADEWHLMGTAASELATALETGELKSWGKPVGEIKHIEIDPTSWRSLTLFAQ